MAMNQAWQDFLATQFAKIEDGVVQHFGDAQSELSTTRTCTVICDLSQFGILKVSGEDAQTFLQNLFSSDVREVTAQHAQISSFNTAKGRMLATFLIWQSGADYFLHLPRSLCAPIQKKLSMYVLRSKVKIADVSDELVCIGLAGVDAESMVGECFSSGQQPQEIMAVAQHNHGSVIRLDKNRYQIVTEPQYAPSLWRCMNDGARPVGSPCWDWLNVRAGVPVVVPATQEQFVPQMANLEVIGGVNFKKGCYPGQEIVARMQYLGKLKRRMYLAHVASEAKPGDELYSAEMEGQSCGIVANASPSPDGGNDVLAVVQISSHDAQTVHIGSLKGEPLEFQPLPYALSS